MMKKLLSLALVLTALLSISIVTNAEEREPVDPEVRFEEHINSMTDKYNENIATKIASYEENMAKKLDNITKKKEIVALYAPELINTYDTSYDAHLDIHASLFNEHLTLREESFDLFLNGLIDLKDELFPLAEAGEMTYKDVGEAFKSYREEQRAYTTSVMDAYKASIADLDDANETNKAVVEGLKVNLRAAVESEDLDAANAIITELHDYLVQHVAYDNAKLAILETVEF